MKRLVIILGMHRSGTSLTAQISRCMGAYLGEDSELLGASLSNLDGHFENKEIVDLDDSLLHICNREWYSLETPFLDYDRQQIKKGMEGIKNVIQKLLEKNDTVVIKDPRICVLLPLWDKVLKGFDIKVDYIWVFRNPLEVMESLRKRDGYSSKHSLLLWIHYNLSVLRYLQGKEYLLINYRDLLEQCGSLKKMSELFGCEFNDDLKWKLDYIIKKEYCCSEHSYQDVMNTQNEFLSDLYSVLLRKRETEVNISEWEKRYGLTIDKIENQFIDYDVLENIRCLEKKEIIIYGAGNYGKRAAEMLQQLGFLKYDFCDRDISKHGTSFMERKVFPITEIENRENLLFIIAVRDDGLKKEIEQTLMCIKNVSFLSFFGLNIVWKYFINDYSTIESKAESFSFWYEKLRSRGIEVKKACSYPVLVYQGGKVGSSTITESLKNVGIENAHIHYFFYKTDTVGELILGDEMDEFRKYSNAFRFDCLEYVESIRNKMKDKLIITMVRDPIAVDLSLVFQWLGNGVADRYFSKQLKEGKTFSRAVSELMLKTKDHMYSWFDEELKEMYGIDILDYPFDREKGYSIISENGIKILIIKVERLSQMAEVIGEFLGNQKIELSNKNVGCDKEYAHIYKEIKGKIRIPKEYVEHYYKNNPYTNHFYSKDERSAFWDKWKGCIK